LAYILRRKDDKVESPFTIKTKQPAIFGSVSKALSRNVKFSAYIHMKKRLYLFCPKYPRKARLHLSVAVRSKASFLICIIVNSVKHINVLCSVATLQLGGNTVAAVVLQSLLHSASLHTHYTL